MSGEPWIFAVLVVIAAVFGVRGSFRVTRRYHDVHDELDWSENAVLLLLVVICWVITFAALWYGFFSVRTVLGFERIEGSAVVGSIIATGVLFMPTLIEYVVDRVARVPWPNGNGE